MKAFGIILKLVAALATVAGIAYVVMKYDDTIVAWVKEKLGITCCCGCCDDDCCCDDDGCCEKVDESNTADEQDFEG